MKPRIYLDNNASTPLDPRVIQVIINDLNQEIGNPSSVHFFGQRLRNRITQSRHSLATFFKVKPSELVFTSGGTEGINMVIRGLFPQNPSCHILTSSIEHACVYRTVKLLEANGCSATYLNPGLWGAVTLDAVRSALRKDTRLIVLMAVNNETGVKTDIQSIAQIAQEANIPFLVDGVALLGKEEFTIPEGVSAMCFSGHKLHAPKGIGLTFIRSNFKVLPLLTGGNQEYGLRAGAENVSGIIGLTEAICMLKDELPQSTFRMEFLKNKLEQGIMQNLKNVIVNGEGPRVVNTTNLSFGGIEGETLLMNLDLEGIAVSHGSACSSGALEPSRILLNMGIPIESARSSIRFSLSRFNTEQEIERCIEIVVKVVTRLRKITRML